MKKLTVCILLITVIASFVYIDNYRDFLSIFCCFGVVYISGGFFVKSCVIYFQRKKIQDLADEIDKLLLDDRFLSKIKNELQKKSDKQLRTD